MKKILFSRQSEEIKTISKLIEKQSHRCLILWAIDCAPRVLAIFEEKYCEDIRPKEALLATIAWSKGEIKMPAAKNAALDAHKSAKQVEDDYAASAAAHAMGHALGTVHVKAHAKIFVMYGLSAFVFRAPEDEKQQVIKQELKILYDRLKYWEKEAELIKRKWAPFLLKNNDANN